MDQKEILIPINMIKIILTGDNPDGISKGTFSNL
jgi:hypothetical protein